MRSEIALLRDINQTNDHFEASEFVSSILRTEINHLRHLAQHGTFHEYAKKYGYPIPNQIVKSSSYLQRPSIENQLSDSINKGRNVILVGCEGSGKSTLVHYVVGTAAHKFGTSPLYIDASDIEGSTDHDAENAMLRKLANAINRISHSPTGKSFETWAVECQKDVFLQSIIDLRSPRGLVEAFIVFLRTHTDIENTYIILDNLDSLSIRANKVLFNTLNRITETVNAACSRLGVGDQKNVRYIICCRTPTYNHVSGPALGLFLNFTHDEIQVEDDFIKKTSILKLMRTFILNPEGRAYKELSGSSATIQLSEFTITTSLEDYFEDVIIWLSKNELTFDRTIKMFCGRSIRRSKLYALKIIGSHIIARLSLLEKYGSIKASVDKSYLNRRLLEAMFEFRGDSSTYFPLNPFKVVRDEIDFKNNPLIGVVAILFLSENRSELYQKEIFFAHSISVEELVNYLQDMKYSENAIKDFFSAALSSGLLRPIPSSDIIIEDTAYEARSVFARYVIDDSALTSLYSLLTAEDPDNSIIFFNSATRSRYELGGPRLVDNWLSEAFTALVFLSDFVKRERQLEQQIEGSGIMLTAPSSRFQGRIMPKIGGILSSFAGSRRLRETHLEPRLRKESERLFARLKAELKSKSSII